MAKKCPKCGTLIIDEQALFCDKCGSKIPKGLTGFLSVCNNCNTPIVDSQSVFCNKCGASLKKATNEKIQIDDKLPLKHERISSVESSKYAHLPLVADGTKGSTSFHNEKISFNKTKSLPNRGGFATKQIQETRCTCLACGKVWHYGKSEVFGNYAAMCRNAGKSISACTCCWPMSYMSREKTDMDKCPSCGSKAIKKEQIIHEVE